MFFFYLVSGAKQSPALVQQSRSVPRELVRLCCILSPVVPSRSGNNGYSYTAAPKVNSPWHCDIVLTSQPLLHHLKLPPGLPRPNLTASGFSDPLLILRWALWALGRWHCSSGKRPGLSAAQNGRRGRPGESVLCFLMEDFLVLSFRRVMWRVPGFNGLSVGLDTGRVVQWRHI